MNVYANEYIISHDGVLTLTNLPFNVGEKIEVIIIPRTKSISDKKSYPFWGKPITYINPIEPVSEADWDVCK